MGIEHAYALLHVKQYGHDTRKISGIASTPELDRQGHMLDLNGATYRNPIPFLAFHNQREPLGNATLHKATADGIPFDATIATIDEPGKLRDRIDEAWQIVKAGLATGVSIGFRILDDGIALLKDGTVKITKFEIVELSLVTIPANMSASILTVKSLAALGPDSNPRGDSRSHVVRLTKDPKAMSLKEHIAKLEGARVTKAARMTEIMTKSADDGATLDDEARKEYDGLALDVKTLDGDLERLRNLEKVQLAAATPITPTTDPKIASDLRGGHVQVKSNAPKGAAFVRASMALLRSRGDSMRALEYAKAWKDTPEVEILVKAAVAPGDTTTPAWAGALVTVNNAQGEFLELLRPATILGKVPNLRQVPFNTQVPLQTGGGTYGWVGQGAPKPVGKLALTTTNLGFSKAAGIIVITMELAKLSSPSAEAVVRADMIAGIAGFLDQQFIDPAVVLVPNVSPASITNGAGTAASSDNASTDLQTILAHFSAANLPLGGITLIMSETNALAMGMKRDAMGNKVFPSMGVAGGSAEGISVIASNAAGQNVIGLSGNNILYADEGGIAIDVSTEASVIMDSDPANAVAPSLTNFWQNNLVGLRAERMINWLRARQEAVYYLTGAAYTV
jgi:HK97 family phage major capsid protein/HK97 family phage prohead protease